MRQSQQKNRMRGRGRKQPNPLSRNYESNGPDVKIRGNAAHIADKYTSLARDALSAGDNVMAENYLQHAEHYNRIVMAAQVNQMRDPDGTPGRGLQPDFGGSYDDEEEDGDDYRIDAPRLPEQRQQDNRQPEGRNGGDHREARDGRDRGRDFNRDGRDGRDGRDNREPRENRDQNRFREDRQPREERSFREERQPREDRQPREERQPRDDRQPREERQAREDRRDERQPREERQPRDERPARQPQEPVSEQPAVTEAAEGDAQPERQRRERPRRRPRATEEGAANGHARERAPSMAPGISRDAAELPGSLLGVAPQPTAGGED